MDPLKATPQPESKLHFLDYWRIIRIRKTVIMAVFFLVVLTATVVTFYLPETYRSFSTIEVEQDQSVDPGLGSGQADRQFNPYFLQTELAKLQSQEILHRVITNLGLNEKWGNRYFGGQKLKTTETYPLLKRQFDPVLERNTKFINLNFVSDDKQEAADVANEIARVYRDFRMEQIRENSLIGIKALEEFSVTQSNKVWVIRSEIAKLRKDLKINETEAAGTGPSARFEQGTLVKIEEQRILIQTALSGEESTLSQLTNATPAELRGLIPTMAPEPLLTSDLTDLSLAESTLGKLQQQLGNEHPDVKTAAKLVEDINKRVDKRVAYILTGIQGRVNSYQTQLSSLQTNLDAAKTYDQKRAEETQPYFDKKLELENFLYKEKMLEMKIFTDKSGQNLPKVLVTIYNAAIPAVKVYRPNKTVNISLGIVLGLIVGVGLAFFIEYLDTSVKTIDDVERALQSPVLGVIPQNVGVLMEQEAESPHAEAYRVLRTNLLFSRKDEKLNAICVVSAGAGEGKSTTIFNLATIFAQNCQPGQRIIIVDSDLRRPTLHKLMNVANSIGLTNYLLKQNTLEEVIQTSSIPTLDFIPSGKLPSSSMGILNSTKMREVITELKKRYDFVFFDSPPIMGVSDASVLASEVDMTLQVIQYRRYPQAMNVRAKQMIEKVGGNLVGIVLNNINVSQDESYYYYSGYYHDYYSRNEEEAANPKKAGRETKTKA